METTYDQGTRVVMGKLSDIHHDAVGYVSGNIIGKDMIRAQQVVILTGYVSVRCFLNETSTVMIEIQGLLASTS
jgi:hypothetical protein